MLITKVSQLTGMTHLMELDITEEQIERFNRGHLVQKVFPHLTAAEREFLITGITPDEWDEMVMDRYEDMDEKDVEQAERDMNKLDGKGAQQ